MKIKFYSSIFLLQIHLIACSSSSYNLYLMTDNATGIDNQTSITTRGVKIGITNQVSLGMNGKVMIKCNINNESKLPIDSKFRIKSLDLFGTKTIEVNLGKHNQIFQEGDTASLTTERKLHLTDTTLFKKIIDKLIDTYP